MKTKEKMNFFKENIEGNTVMAQAELDMVVGGFAYDNTIIGDLENLLTDIAHDTFRLVSKYYHEYTYLDVHAADVCVRRAQQMLLTRRYLSYIATELSDAQNYLSKVDDSLAAQTVRKLVAAIILASNLK